MRLIRALSIRQPFAELILWGIKTVEYRSRSTRIIGERFYIYASKGRSWKPQASSQKIWSVDLSDKGNLPAWMIELAEQVGMIEPELLSGTLLPTGVIVGSAVIERVTGVRGQESRARSVGNAPHLLTPDACALTPSSLTPDTCPLIPSPLFRWHLTGVERFKTLRKPKGHPQPVWFEPF
jgi:hypothetical protein